VLVFSEGLVQDEIANNTIKISKRIIKLGQILVGETKDNKKQ
jgi:hypothetical protein